MTKIYNATTGTAHNISIMQDGIHCEDDILGNMAITGPDTGIHAVADDGPSCADEAEAEHFGCRYYGDDEAVTWWVDYVRGYNATLSDISDAKVDIEYSGKSAEDIAEALGIDYSRHNTAKGAIIEWLKDNQVDYENERGAFEEKLAQLREQI